MARVPIRIITRLGHSHSGGPSAAPKITTGIEHATALKKVNPKPADWSQYKCSEYLHFNKHSFYDPELQMASHRVAQPTNKKPDVAPSFKKA
ncbi:hypothetical protein PRIPAC_77375 [Pristionchus pacificus]|uniref:Complex I-9kD n=1 Tax=Pristionchus pacificus TaxID=54126 RepID=A0A2A6CBY2_PRIPA|nr:hypothetical protein PRIPAC_77375 [Pristionchus pacificus]|eukprot:PDM75649.1 hypothetical protein PRIPAC_42826 [Pristionchus pacificus]